MRYRIKVSKQYKKDYKKLVKAGKNVSKLRDVIDALANGKNLDAKYRDHPLKGNLLGKREWHISSDWLLFYEKENDALLLLLLGTGDHRHVLNIE